MVAVFLISTFKLSNYANALWIFRSIIHIQTYFNHSHQVHLHKLSIIFVQIRRLNIFSRGWSEIVWHCGHLITMAVISFRNIPHIWMNDWSNLFDFLIELRYCLHQFLNDKIYEKSQILFFFSSFIMIFFIYNLIHFARSIKCLIVFSWISIIWFNHFIHWIV